MAFQAVAQDLTFYPSALKSGIDGSMSSIDLNMDGEVEVAIMGKDEDGYNFTKFYSWSGGSFHELPTYVTQVSEGNFTWLDFNLDQQIDLFLTGIDSNGKIVAEFYQNNGNFFLEKVSIPEVPAMATVNPVLGDFNQDGYTELIITGVDQHFNSKITRFQFEKTGIRLLPVDLPSIAYGRLAVLDANNDGVEDLIMSGINPVNGQRITHLYQNNGSGAFFLQQDNFQALAHTEIAFIDIHRDGFQDLLVTGFDIDGNKKGELYLNTEGQFSNSESFDLPDLSHAAFAVSDFNLDGWDDLIICGNNNSFQPTSYFFLNDNGSLIQSSPFLPILERPMFIITDLDGSNGGDLIFSGTGSEQLQSGYYLNDTQPRNNPPQAVEQVVVETLGNDLRIRWSDAEDDQSIFSTLRYMVGIKSAVGDFHYHQEWINGNEVIKGHDLPLISVNHCLLKNISAGEYEISLFTIDQQGIASSVYNQSYQHCPDRKILQDTTICPGTTLSLEIDSDPESTSWYVSGTSEPFPGNRFSLIFDLQNTVLVEFTESTGCKVKDTFQVKVFQKPGFNLPEFQKICAGNEVFWQSEVDYQKINASFKGQFLDINYPESISFKPEADGIFKINTQDQNGCYDSAQSNIQIQPIPDFDLPPIEELCIGDSFKLPQFVGLEIKWQINQIIEAKGSYFKPIEQKSLIVGTAKNLAGCLVSDTISLHLLPPPNLNLPDTFWTCPGDTFKLALDHNSEYSKLSWTTNLDPAFEYEGFSPRLMINQSQNLTLSIEDSMGCHGREVISLQTNSVSPLELGEDTAICVSQSHVLVTKHEDQLHKWWINGMFISTEQFDSLRIEISESQQVICETVDANGCRFRDSIIIEAKSLPPEILADTTILCSGDSLFLSIPDSLSVFWVNMNSDQNWFQQQLNILPGGSFILDAELTSPNGCRLSNSTFVKVNMLPEPPFPSDTAICKGTELILPLKKGDTIKWSSDDPPSFIESGFKYSAIEDKTLHYQVVDQNHCTQAASLKIYCLPLPEINTEKSYQICQKDSFSIDLGVNDSISWWVNETYVKNGPDLLLHPNETTEVMVNAINNYGCENGRIFYVKVRELPVINAGEDQFVCNAAPAYLKAEFAADISQINWVNMDGEIISADARFVAYPEKSDRFILFVRDEFGCENHDTVSIYIDEPLSLKASNDSMICVGNTLDLIAENQNLSFFEESFSWFDEDFELISKNHQISVSPSYSTNYSVVGVNGDCEPDTLTVEIEVIPRPTLTTADSIMIGFGEEAILSVKGADYYLWEPERDLEYPNSANPIVSPPLSKTYYVHGFDHLGCEAIDSVTVIVKNSIFIPDYFSPNQDGLNDTFKVFGSGIKVIEFRIQALNGKELYYSNDPAQLIESGWDGQIAGSPVPSGAYLWQMTGRFEDGSTLAFQGRNSGIFYVVR